MENQNQISDAEHKALHRFAQTYHEINARILLEDRMLIAMFGDTNRTTHREILIHMNRRRFLKMREVV